MPKAANQPSHGFPDVIAAATLVVVLLNGVPIPSSVAARIVRGVVMAPLAPVVARIATSASFDPATGAVSIKRNERDIVLHVGARTAETGGRTVIMISPPYVRGETIMLPLALVARALGATVTYDPRARIVSLGTPVEPLATMSPWNAEGSPAPQRTLFTPEPVTTPRPVFTGTPRPRRTAVPGMSVVELKG